MKVLVVGGTGALGGHAALHLAAKGHDVTITGRGEGAHPDTPLTRLGYLRGDYVAGDFTPERLRGFDWVVFAAGNDPRHVPPGEDFGAWLHRANHVALPAFFAAAREAGVSRAIQLGSFYAQAAPELLEGNVYIRSRLAACEGARAEGRPGFDVISVNAPFMVGTVPGLPSAIFEPYTQWAKGLIPIPAYAPTGGTNFMSFRSLSEAIEGALLRGEPGKAYLVGDENLSFAQYFQLFFDAAGRSDVRVEPLDQELPLLPDVAIPQGRGNFISYEPDADETALLGYHRRDVANAVREIIAQFG
ncbi:NAD(P)-dependent oxidoreductase [Novosphingobium sp. Fuku2-ISO-50]|uniref:NAD-dependent epimerase/dehydratase family protein n=1 Tax=Novosphingobium sp. Fuku2-ISO-50 TaxID=1739114 RepID=UPI00076D037B|nr:NAD-dependent epimerase/dehydratase family protein [Novosphingobium sp. Fuku2-ISO-50]KUR81087.1 nucleoside-diphosphate sugar epimerase [Novosphingobium sp. Fuku2-ISO-50]